jgi:hypothetical protein
MTGDCARAHLDETMRIATLLDRDAIGRAAVCYHGDRRYRVTTSRFRVNIFADGASLDGMMAWARRPGFELSGEGQPA